MFSSAVPYKKQHYAEIKKNCLRERTLFEDPEFPATSSSLYFSEAPPGNVEWKRPGEITSEPHLFVEGISAHDLNQGSVGNCWFVAACSCLALKPNLWKKVIPDWKGQEWDSRHPEGYAGIFHFQFWLFGEWVDVVVDDRLPTIRGQLLYCHSQHNNEFWSALLEKAYAKLFGCYESLKGGNTGDAVVDFSGAVAEVIKLEEDGYWNDQEKQNELFEELLKVWDCDGIISCSIKAEPHEIENRMANGLVKGHAYSVTAVKKVHLGDGLLAYFRNETIPLIRMRNPWGQTEWKGAWSDRSEEWSKVGYTERGNLGITVADDGEFWMSFTDWCKLFTDATVCRLINTSAITIHKTWHEVTHFGKWTRNTEPLLNRCGGSFNNKQTFLQNPQYLFDVTKEADEVLIYVQQKDQRINGRDGQGKNLTIGFSVFKVELNRKYRMHHILTQKNVVNSIYINARSVFKRVMLPLGRYIIFPTTFDPYLESDFLLRIYTDLESSCRDLTEDEPKIRSWWCACLGYPQAVTHVYIHAVDGLGSRDETRGADPYLIIDCEGKRVKSTIHKDTLNPEFATGAVFYRKNLRKPVTVEVWNSNTVKDQFMGRVVLPGLPKDSPDFKRFQLLKRGLHKNEKMPGSIMLKIVTSTELTAI
ncbi:calpain-5-like isoform 1-T3 [Pholidichthys leucotaenia]